MTIDPGKELGEFVAALVETGRYRTASEVVREGLRLLQEKSATSKLEELRALIDEGEHSGDPVTWNAHDFLSRINSRSNDQ
jgi:antitoxin ParD1/3/4